MDVELSALADRQHGVVSLPQLTELGLSPTAVRSRVQVGRLHRKHRGVYAVGRARLTREGRWMAAVLAYGPKAVLSHRSAAAHWGLLQDGRATIDITVPVGSIRSRPGIAAHVSSRLYGAQVCVVDSIPSTTVARVLLDLAGEAGAEALKRAIGQAETKGLFHLEAVHSVLELADGRRGASVLRGVLAELAAFGRPAGLTESELEDRFGALCRAAALPAPEAATWLTLSDGSAIKVDFLWRRERVVVECDGYRFHRGRVAFERDHRRDAQLALLGIETLRFTWGQVTAEPEHVVRVVAAVLARRRGDTRAEDA